jgi:CBS domain-containing protein
MSLDRFRTAVATVDADDTVQAAAAAMRDRGVGALLVLRDGVPSGIVTDRDLVLRVVADGLSPAAVCVGQVVTYDPITVSVHDGIETAVQRMRKHGIRRLPVVDERGRAVGIVTSDDLLMLLGAEISAVCEGIENRTDATESR